MELREIQGHMRRLYLHRDSERGVLGTMLWLVSEVGELSNLIVKRGDRRAMADEAADILAWLCSECNLIGVDLEEAFTEKYGDGCPRCGRIPCKCGEP
ncbi:MAG: MazG nucleotide pyrophosphohydrolase domain-containing protein [Candidatus Bathyarchaeia archaeon]|nr:nucleotide pyrophosphohydrolase [Candidatus Bathyarchaeota archaeon]